MANGGAIFAAIFFSLWFAACCLGMPFAGVWLFKRYQAQYRRLKGNPDGAEDNSNAEAAAASALRAGAQPVAWSTASSGGPCMQHLQLRSTAGSAGQPLQSHTASSGGAQVGQMTPQHTERDLRSMTIGAPADPWTLGESSDKGKLIMALENLALAEPMQLFASKYALLNERAAGGQAVVNFARDARGGFFQYAIKCATSAYTSANMLRALRAWSRIAMCSKPHTKASAAVVIVVQGQIVLVGLQSAWAQSSKCTVPSPGHHPKSLRACMCQART